MPSVLLIFAITFFFDGSLEMGIYTPEDGDTMRIISSDALAAVTIYG